MDYDRAHRPDMSSGEGAARATPSDASSITDGTYFLGRYRVVDEIGVGGMASVHLARMDGPGGFQKWVAIKKIHPHLVEDDTFVQMFLDEGRVAARISHPNVASVLDLGKHESTYWIAMEYLHGEPLRELMRRTEELGTAMPPEIACRIIADAAEGLHAAHELVGRNGEKLEVVHRDVTPHNLFVTYDGVTKVVDFGIAKFASRISNTRAGTLKGKLAYMSPEQVHGEVIDRRTDIFALGVVLWELTTGQRLFRMDNDLDTLAKVQECKVPKPSTLIRGYPVDLEKIVLKTLSKNRNDRYKTARELSRELQSLLMRRGLFVASDEVASYTQSIFADRIQKRDAHLRWASEVTQTINIDPLGKPRIDEEVPSTAPQGGAPARLAQPAPVRPAAGVPAHAARFGPAPGAAGALHDDDDDVHPADRDGPTIQGVPMGLELDDDTAPALLDDDEEEDETRVAAAPEEARGGRPIARPSPQAAFAGQRPPPSPTRPDAPNALGNPRAGFSGPASMPQPVLGAPLPPPPPFGVPSSNPFDAPSSASGPVAPPRSANAVFVPSRIDARTATVQRYRPRPPMWLIVALSGGVAMLLTGIVLVVTMTSGSSSDENVTESGHDPFMTARTAFLTAIAVTPPAAMNPAPPSNAAATVDTAATPPSRPSSSANVAPPSTPTVAAATPPPVASPKPTPAKPASTPQTAPVAVAKPTPSVPKKVGTGTLTVVCMPKCDQIVDNGTALGPGHIFNRPVAAGHHVLQLSAPNGVHKTVSVDIDAGGSKDVRTSMDR